MDRSGARRPDQEMTTRWLGRWLQPDRNPAGVVYGTMMVGALLAAESSRQESFRRLVEATAVALFLYWLAHAYARMLAERYRDPTRWTLARFGRALWHEWAIVRGAAVPLLVLLVAWAAGAALQTGATVALWASAATVVLVEFVSGLRAHLRPVELTVDVAIGAVIGLGIILLKVILH